MRANCARFGLPRRAATKSLEAAVTARNRPRRCQDTLCDSGTTAQMWTLRIHARHIRAPKDPAIAGSGSSDVAIDVWAPVAFKAASRRCDERMAAFQFQLAWCRRNREAFDSERRIPSMGLGQDQRKGERKGGFLTMLGNAAGLAIAVQAGVRRRIVVALHASRSLHRTNTDPG